ncbi:UNKNOWN [Stylonychia lemnae]|uniref:Uncharacterized protein n=1 Tax=Stylonychia lemnae TaxID=5949 RepID=A0A078BDE0_STYLE|nr:UNKNOWN [Stylonychia lemnae]|eukprot:CDW91613.1 UNKNOWN [Stylonychia lemnae]
MRLVQKAMRQKLFLSTNTSLAGLVGTKQQLDTNHIKQDFDQIKLNYNFQQNTARESSQKMRLENFPNIEKIKNYEENIDTDDNQEEVKKLPRVANDQNEKIPNIDHQEDQIQNLSNSLISKNDSNSPSSSEFNQLVKKILLNQPNVKSKFLQPINQMQDNIDTINSRQNNNSANIIMNRRKLKNKFMREDVNNKFNNFQQQLQMAENENILINSDQIDDQNNQLEKEKDELAFEEYEFISIKRKKESLNFL